MFYLSGATLAANVVTPTIGDATTVVTLQPNIPTLMTVRIYVEGWDAQTSNAVLAAAFKVSFKFSLKSSSI